MSLWKSTFKTALCGMSVLVVLLATIPAHSENISWTTWSTNTSGAISDLGITVTYAGELDGLSAPGYPSWMPATTFSGGTVGNPPPSSGRMVQLRGGNMSQNSITFSTPVVDPVMAIWSLGQGGIMASFVFNDAEPFTIESGGRSQEYGGSSIVVCPGNPFAVCGSEGNGTIQFHGVFTSISWTNPVFENYYGFTVGVPGTAVPEPSSFVMMASMLFVGLGVSRRRLR